MSEQTPAVEEGQPLPELDTGMPVNGTSVLAERASIMPEDIGMPVNGAPAVDLNASRAISNALSADLGSQTVTSDGAAITGGGMGQSPVSEQLSALEVNGDAVNNAGTLAAANIGAGQSTDALAALGSSPTMTPTIPTADVGAALG